MAASLSIGSTIDAVRRIAIRGTPNCIYSDNDRNLNEPNNELRKMWLYKKEMKVV